jgi:hypothetical protein
MILFDLDDLAFDERSDRDIMRLLELREEIPTLKVTLFAIPAICPDWFLRRLKIDLPFADLVQHGWHHRTCYECLAWTKADCKAALKRGRDMGFTTKGFKAPGWQISDGCYEALAEKGYWVADQAYNDARREKVNPQLAAYVIRTHFTPSTYGMRGVETFEGHAAIHGHVGHLGGHNANALELIMDDIRAAAAKDTDFRFIREVMET